MCYLADPQSDSRPNTFQNQPYNFILPLNDICINTTVIKEGESAEMRPQTSSARRPRAPEEALIQRATLDYKKRGRKSIGVRWLSWECVVKSRKTHLLFEDVQKQLWRSIYFEWKSFELTMCETTPLPFFLYRRHPTHPTLLSETAHTEKYDHKLNCEHF